MFEGCKEELKLLAFTHSSYANEHDIDSNERVEFLGDSVLSTIVSDFLYKNYHKAEGKMSKIRANFVCTENLALVARDLGIEQRIRFGHSFKGKAISNAILADTVESMIGVLYLTYGITKIQPAVLDLLDIRSKMKAGQIAHDYKSELQEYTQAQKQKLTYKVEKYLLDNGTENFRANCFVDGDFLSYGQGSTKREAEQNAAHLALKKLTTHPHTT